MGQKVSLREYAKIRGVHLNAVQTAVKSGRIHKIRANLGIRKVFLNMEMRILRLVLQASNKPKLQMFTIAP